MEFSSNDPKDKLTMEDKCLCYKKYFQSQQISAFSSAHKKIWYDSSSCVVLVMDSAATQEAMLQVLCNYFADKTVVL